MRPVQMSKARIYIDQDEIPALINYLPRLPFASIKEISSPDDELTVSHSPILHEKIVEYQKKIQTMEENLDFIAHSLDFTKKELEAYNEMHDFKTKDLLTLFNLVDLEIGEFRHNIEQTETESRNLAINKINLSLNRALLQILEQFHMTAKVLQKLHNFSLLIFSVLTASVGKIEMDLFKSEITTFFSHQSYSPDRSFYLLICKSEDVEEIRALLKIYNPEFLEIPHKYLTETGIDLNLMERDFASIEAQILDFNKKNASFRTDSLGRFLRLQEVLANIKVILNVEQQFLIIPPHTAVLEIWTPSTESKRITKQLEKEFGPRIQVKYTEMKYSEISFEEGYGKEGKSNAEEEIPTLTKHNWLVRPFLTLLRLYGVPRYTEIDPTVFIAITFPLLFGLMFADVGHGLVIIIVGIIGLIVLRHKSQGTRDMAQIIIYCGFGAILGGFLMGEFFGERISTIPYLQWGTFLNVFEEPLQNIGFIFKVVLLIGVVHICLGWIIQAANYSMSKRKYLAFADSGLKIALLVGGTYLLFTYEFDLTAWMSGAFPPILFPLIPGLLLVFMRAVGKIFHLRYLEQKSVGGLLGESSVDTMETFLSILSNVASYSRLMALNLSHLGLMLVVKIGATMIAQGISDPLASEIIVTVCVVLGNMLVIVIEVLIVFIHNMRLHFYEFFSKFYKGSGVPFKQFKLANKYSEINFIHEIVA